MIDEELEKKFELTDGWYEREQVEWLAASEKVATDYANENVDFSTACVAMNEAYYVAKANSYRRLMTGGMGGVEK